MARKSVERAHEEGAPVHLSKFFIEMVILAGAQHSHKSSGAPLFFLILLNRKALCCID